MPGLAYQFPEPSNTLSADGRADRRAASVRQHWRECRAPKGLVMAGVSGLSAERFVQVGKTHVQRRACNSIELGLGTHEMERAVHVRVMFAL